MSRFSSSSWNWLTLAAITALAAVLRLWQINDSLWVDELHTSWCVHGGLSQVAERASAGNQSPLYFYLVWGVTRLLGESEFTLRLPSLLAGIALPPALFLLVRQLGPIKRMKSAALLAAFLVSIDHASLFIATEARPYALVELLAAASLILAINVGLQGTLSCRIGLVAIHVTLFYLHCTAALYIAGVLACLLVWAIVQPKGSPFTGKTWLVDTGATALLCLAAVPQILEVASRRENWAFVKTESPADLFTTFPWIVCTMGLLLFCLWRRNRVRPSTLLIPAVCLIPIIVAWVLTYWEIVRLFHPRYLVAALSAMWGAVAFVSQIPENTRWRQLAAVGIAGLALWSSGIRENFLVEGKPLIDRSEDWRSAIPAAEEQHRQHPGWKILVHSGLIETDVLRQPHDVKWREYGLLPVKALYPLQAEDNDLIPLPFTDPGQLTPETQDEVLRAGGAVIILRLSEDKAVAVEENLAQSLQAKHAALTIVKRQSFGDLQVINCEVKPTP